MREITRSGPRVGVGLGVSVAVAVGDAVAVGLAVTVGLGVAVGVCVLVDVEVAVDVGLLDGIAVAVAEGATVGVSVSREEDVGGMASADCSATRSELQATRMLLAATRTARHKRIRLVNGRPSAVRFIRDKCFLVQPPSDGDQLVAVAVKLVQSVGTIERFDLKTGLAQEQLKFAAIEIA